MYGKQCRTPPQQSPLSSLQMGDAPYVFPAGDIVDTTRELSSTLLPTIGGAVAGLAVVEGQLGTGLGMLRFRRCQDFVF